MLLLIIIIPLFVTFVLLTRAETRELEDIAANVDGAIASADRVLRTFECAEARGEAIHRREYRDREIPASLTIKLIA